METITIGIFIGLALLVILGSCFLILLMFFSIRPAVREIGDMLDNGFNWNKILRISVSLFVLLFGLFFSYQFLLFALKQGGSTLERQEQIERSSEETVQMPRQKAPLISGEKEIPEQLLDVSLEIDDLSVRDIKELTSRVIFTSFGTGPASVDLTFTILNESGDIIYTAKDYIVVETEAVFTKKFEDIKPAPGKYTLILNILYNVDVEDEFSQDFEILL